MHEALRVTFFMQNNITYEFPIFEWNPSLNLKKEDFLEKLKGEIPSEMFEKMKIKAIPGIMMAAEPWFIKSYYEFTDDEMKIFNRFILHCQTVEGSSGNPVFTS